MRKVAVWAWESLNQFNDLSQRFSASSSMTHNYVFFSYEKNKRTKIIAHHDGKFNLGWGTFELIACFKAKRLQWNFWTLTVAKKCDAKDKLLIYVLFKIQSILPSTNRLHALRWRRKLEHNLKAAHELVIEFPFSVSSMFITIFTANGDENAFFWSGWSRNKFSRQCVNNWLSFIIFAFPTWKSLTFERETFSESLKTFSLRATRPSQTSRLARLSWQKLPWSRSSLNLIPQRSDALLMTKRISVSISLDVINLWHETKRKENLLKQANVIKQSQTLLIIV